jgi:hypothetical protein
MNFEDIMGAISKRYQFRPLSISGKAHSFDDTQYHRRKRPASIR